MLREKECGLYTSKWASRLMELVCTSCEELWIPCARPVFWQAGGACEEMIKIRNFYIVYLWKIKLYTLLYREL